MGGECGSGGVPRVVASRVIRRRHHRHHPLGSAEMWGGVRWVVGGTHRHRRMTLTLASSEEAALAGRLGAALAGRLIARGVACDASREGVLARARGNDRASVVTARAGRNETFEYARIRRRRFCRRAFQRIGRLSNAPKYRSTNRRATGTSRFQKDDPADQNGRRSRGRRSAIATTTDHDGRFWAIEATRARGRLGRDTRRVAAHRALAPPRVFSPRVFAPTRRASDATSRAGRVVAAS